MLIIIGLGNPGPRYLLTRHNVGFRVVDRLSEQCKIPLYKVGHHSYYGKGKLAGEEVILAKPMTYMNGSGLAAASLCRFFKIPPENLFVVYDDLDLPLGTLRLRPGGGSGGHNGMKSMIDQLCTEEFPRMRIGINRPHDGNVVDYVLQPFSVDEQPVLEELLPLAAEAAAEFIKHGILEAMNKYNKKDSNKKDAQ
ncbi:MAG: aminoacyl-tRNA hydrolase [Clostridiales bacterium]|jgi:PTH1 family peptidyl-tRNA hydrolase|nr:aminoacyl-tRNA hydrolase [Clostridiales bacterium]